MVRMFPKTVTEYFFKYFFFYWNKVREEGKSLILNNHEDMFVCFEENKHDKQCNETAAKVANTLKDWTESVQIENIRTNVYLAIYMMHK